jgi:hypothetical protein
MTFSLLFKGVLKGEFPEKDYLSIKACCTIEYQSQIFINCEKYAGKII